MLLRWLVTNFLRQAAQEKIREFVSQTVQEVTQGSEPRTAVAPEELDQADVAVVVSTGLEAGGVLERLEERRSVDCSGLAHHLGRWQGRRVLVIQTGTGLAAAESGARHLIEQHHPKWVVAAGFASALDEKVHRGHLVMPDQVISGQSEYRIPLGMDSHSLASLPYLHVGRLVTVDHLVQEPDERRQLGSEHQALACDMETAALARVCQEQKTRFLAVRIVTDAVDDRLPPEIEQLFRESSTAARLGLAAGTLVNRPAVLKQLWDLRQQGQRASQRLAGFLAGIVSQLD